MIENFGLFILGVIQGIIEWLPISSQGNLSILITSFSSLSLKQVVNLAIFLHLGTILSALIYFRNDILNYLSFLRNYNLKKPFKGEENKVISFLLITTVITGALGFLFYTQLNELLSVIQGKAFVALIGSLLILTGVIQKISKGKEHKKEKNLNLLDSLLLGIGQSLSILPGISRSGTTISLFLLRDYNQETSLKLSFIMSIPAVLGANLFLYLSGDFIILSPIQILLTVATSFFVGYIALVALFKVAKKIKFWIFCLIIGILAVSTLLI